MRTTGQHPTQLSPGATGSSPSSPTRPSARASRAFVRDPLAAGSVLLAVVALIGCLVLWRRGGGTVDIPWAPTRDLRLTFTFDGIAALYGLLAAAIGTAVFAYGAAYLPLHLAQAGRPARERWRFWPWMALFLVTMVGLAAAQDLIVLFVLFDLTAVCSYFLIGFDREQRATRLAALMALLVTGIGAVAMLVGAVILASEHGTFAIPELAAALTRGGTPGTATTAALALIAIAALVKSAQVPFHFWLPRAMAAPTPVSAYLHSAAMVAAGVLVIGRTYELLAVSAVVRDGLLVVGLASIAVGGVLALTRDGFKQVLAHSTISQYGYVVVLYGIGGEHGATAAAFYVVAHAVAKSALFLTAGAVTMATGGRRLSDVGGLGRELPWLAVASAVAAATLSALPLTVGFFKDELFFRAAADRSPTLAALAVVAAALTFAYTWRFWARIFLGPRRTGVRPLPVLLVAPIVVLALLAVVGGIVVAPVAELAADAATATLGHAVALHLSYEPGVHAEYVMAVAAWALGGLLLATPRVWGPAARAVARAGDVVGPGRLYELTLRGLIRVSDVLHDVEVRDLRSRVAAVLLPGGVLTLMGFAATPTAGVFRVGSIDGTDLLVVALLALVAIASVVVTFARQHVAIVLSLAVVGLCLATVYALLGAPDVALVAVLVETVLTLVFLAIIGYGARVGRPPARTRTAAAVEPARRTRRWRDPLIGAVAGGTAFLVMWAALSRTAATDPVIAEQVRLAPSAHGADVVTVILADFRGLDTLVEVTVILVALFGVIALLRRGRAW